MVDRCCRFCVSKTSAELESINCTVSPLNSPACFVSQTAASLSNAFIIAQVSVSQIHSSRVCVTEWETRQQYQGVPHRNFFLDPNVEQLCCSVEMHKIIFLKICEVSAIWRRIQQPLQKLFYYFDPKSNFYLAILKCFNFASLCLSLLVFPIRTNSNLQCTPQHKTYMMANITLILVI